jgi:dGTPase
MTHSLEVAQLARSVARVLRLSEDLVEAIALAHDLGHTPFGHAGQDALNACMVDHGGFEHNFQSLRVVDSLESRYPQFDGLNLTFETREGVLKHCSAKNAKYLDDKDSKESWAKDDCFQSLGYRFLHHKQPSLEAQLCNLADEVAYNAHDIDDGIRSGLIDIEQLSVVSLFEEFKVQVLNEHPKLGTRKLAYETIRRMLSAQVYDIIATTQSAIEQRQVCSFEQVSEAPALVGFSDRMRLQSLELKRFLFQNLYRHSKVVHTTNWAKNVVTELFQAYVDNPTEMPSPALDRASLHRSVADYIAGMTDRFAGAEYVRLCGESSKHAVDLS